MKFLINGQWSDETGSHPRLSRQGVVHAGGFRHRITHDGSSGFPAEPRRYHLYVSHACPFSHRVTMVRALMGLDQIVDLSLLHPRWDTSAGWMFGETAMSTADQGGCGFSSLHEAYLASDPTYTGRVSVPVLWDKVTRTIVNNESLDIAQMLDAAFTGCGAASRIDLYPKTLRPAIDALNARTASALANGVYDIAGARTQTEYDLATAALFDFLDELERQLSDGRSYLLGEAVTLADVLAFTPLVRFDPVYRPLFRIGRKRLGDFPQLTAFVRRLFGIPEIVPTVRFDQILMHYYDSDWAITPHRGIVPNLSAMEWYSPPGQQ
jgi:putative glutathione S-transferase